MPKEYIPREAAWDTVLSIPAKTDADGYCWVVRGVVARALDNIPAADVVEVVRCRDCKHAGDPWGRNHIRQYCFRRLATVTPDYYCAYGKRKDGGQDDG